MYSSRKISIILPCLNEELGLPVVLSKIREISRELSINTEVIVVDNNSTDNTGQIAKQNGAIVIKEPKRGYGQACRAGFARATEDYIILGDADNSYDFLELPHLLRNLENNDVIIGSRYLGTMHPQAMPLSHRYIGNPFIRLLLHWNGLHLRETSTGFIAFRREILKKISLRCTGMEFSSEFLIKIAQANLKVTEIPITYTPRLGTSKIREIRDGLRHLVVLCLAKLA